MAPTDETRVRLLDAAGQVFADKGFDSATVREICQLADANIAAVNYHFGDKKRLYIEAVREAYCVRSDAFPVLPPQEAGVTPEVRLRHYVHTFMTRLLGEGHAPWHLALVLREIAQPTEACTEIVNDYIRPMAKILGEIVGEAMPDPPAFEPHLACFSIVGQCLFHYVHRPIIRELVGEEEHARHDIERLADHITRFSIAALTAGSKKSVPAPIKELTS